MSLLRGIKPLGHLSSSGGIEFREYLGLDPSQRLSTFISHGCSLQTKAGLADLPLRPDHNQKAWMPLAFRSIKYLCLRLTGNPIQPMLQWQC